LTIKQPPTVKALTTNEDGTVTLYEVQEGNRGFIKPRYRVVEKRGPRVYPHEFERFDAAKNFFDELEGKR